MNQNGRFINTNLKMQNFPRWDEYASKFKDNCSRHSYRVGVYTLLSALLENKMFQNCVDVEKAVFRAIFHDVNETKIGPKRGYNIRKLLIIKLCCWTSYIFTDKIGT